MGRAADRRRFDGEIAGVGSTTGVRVVVGRWRVSPLGPFADVMVEQPDGRRTLLAPSDSVADFVASTYVFDEVVLTPVLVQVTRRAWHVETDPLELDLVLGRRTPVGHLVRLVPRWVTRTTWFATAADPFARLLLRGVRTRGSTGGGRREWYGARDVRRVESMRGRWNGADVGALAPVDPPVRFGFGSTPRDPCVVSVTTTVELG